jgi:single-stranded DNA-binding protein
MLHQISFTGTISEIDLTELGYTALLTITQPRMDKPEEPPDVSKFELVGQAGALAGLREAGIADGDKVFGVAYQLDHKVAGSNQWLRLQTNMIGLAGVETPERLVATFTGNVGRDATMSYSETSGTAKTFFTIALNNTSANASGGLDVSTVWLNINVLGSVKKGNKRAEAAAERVVKGATAQVAVYKMGLRPYTNGGGNEGMSIDCLASNFAVISSPVAKEKAESTIVNDMPSAAARAAAGNAGVVRTITTPTNGTSPNGAVPVVKIDTGF